MIITVLDPKISSGEGKRRSVYKHVLYFRMSRIDRIKEKIGYLKVIFGLMVAVEVSMVGWLFQHASEIDSVKIGGFVMQTFISLVAVVALGAIVYSVFETLNHGRSRTQH